MQRPLDLKPSFPTAGFTLVEVLVSILISTIFVAVSLQGMMAATMLRAKALQQNEAANWIQTDLEILRWQSTEAQLAFSPERCGAATADQGFADALRDRIAQTNVTGTSPYQVPIQVRRSTTGQSFELARTLLLNDNQPSQQILGIQYQVQPVGQQTPILSFYAEVLPDAALQCS